MSALYKDVITIIASYLSIRKHSLVSSLNREWNSATRFTAVCGSIRDCDIIELPEKYYANVDNIRFNAERSKFDDLLDVHLYKQKLRKLSNLKSVLSEDGDYHNKNIIENLFRISIDKLIIISNSASSIVPFIQNITVNTLEISNLNVDHARVCASKFKYMSLTTLKLKNCDFEGYNLHLFESLPDTLVHLTLDNNNLNLRYFEYIVNYLTDGPFETLHICNNDFGKLTIEDFVNPSWQIIFIKCNIVTDFSSYKNITVKN